MYNYQIAFEPINKQSILDILPTFNLIVTESNETNIKFDSNRYIAIPFIKYTSKTLYDFLFQNYFNNMEQINELISKYVNFAKQRGVDLTIDIIDKKFTFSLPCARDEYGIFTIEVPFTQDIRNYHRIMLFIFNVTNIYIYKLKLIKYLHAIDNNINRCDELSAFQFQRKNSKYGIQIFTQFCVGDIEYHWNNIIKFKYDEMPDEIKNNINEVYELEDDTIDDFSNSDLGEEVVLYVYEPLYDSENGENDENEIIHELVKINELIPRLNEVFAMYNYEEEGFEVENGTIIIDENCPSF